MITPILFVKHAKFNLSVYPSRYSTLLLLMLMHVAITDLTQSSNKLHCTCNNAVIVIPVTVQPNVSLALPEMLEMIRCGCATDASCSTAMCGCYTAHLPCTLFCGCHKKVHCQNEHTRSRNARLSVPATGLQRKLTD